MYISLAVLSVTRKILYSLRYFITFAYKGTAYHGWQRQPNAISVQEVLENCLSHLLRTPVTIMGAGRTDTGVHARQMVAHFDLRESIDEVQCVFRLNSFLPKDIAVATIQRVQDTAHARFDAVSRTYHYHIHFWKNPFLENASYALRDRVSIEDMNVAAKLLLNYTNFKCFSKTGSDVKTYTCKLTEARWEQIDTHQYRFCITADRFLRNMVRAVVGTLLEIGNGKYDVSYIHDVIQTEDRSKAGFSVPAHGLYLSKVVYPVSIYM